MTAQELLIKAEKYLTMLDSEEQRADPDYQAFRRELHRYNEGGSVVLATQTGVRRVPDLDTYIMCYGHYTNENYGANTMKVTINKVTYWFSYNTLIAFSSEITGRVVHKNVWGPTTGKHLKWIDGGDQDHHRVDAEEFERKLKVALTGVSDEPTTTVTIDNPDTFDFMGHTIWP